MSGNGTVHVVPMRVEATEHGPRYWLNGKPECGVFTLDELRAAFPDEGDLRGFLRSNDRIIFDVTGKVTR